MAASIRCLLVVGTRPEAIKLAPIFRAASVDPLLDTRLVLTGQHSDMLEPIMRDLSLRADDRLTQYRPGLSPAQMAADILRGTEAAVRRYEPDVVVVEGDTTSAVATALGAFYCQVALCHVEAGLRTRDRRLPYPEETNRRLISRVTDLHLAPTRGAAENLHREQTPDPVFVTGNTVIDALHWAVEAGPEDPVGVDPSLGLRRPLVLVTAHRRESWGAPMRGIARAIGRLAQMHPGWDFLMPLHQNPVVRDSLVPVLGDVPNVTLSEPLTYLSFTRLLERSRLVVTDSGGLQEEAPALGKPVLVLREDTERREGVAAGTVRVIGVGENGIVDEVSWLMSDPLSYARMAGGVNPYGDGRAAVRSVRALKWLFGREEAPRDFTAADQPSSESDPGAELASSRSTPPV